MRKYLAVVKDSFREALASRVLWLTLVCISLILIGLAPLGYRQEMTWRLGDNDVQEWPDLMELVRSAGSENVGTPAGRLWELLDQPLRQRLVEVRIPGKDPEAANPFAFLGVFRDFRRAVNGMLQRRDFYEPASFQDVQLLSKEVRELRDLGLDALSESELARFNRLVLEAAFPNLIRGSSPTSIQLVYGWFDFGTAFPLGRQTLRDSLRSTVAWSLNWFIGAIGIFVAILVTAPIVPQMFDPGSLHLLLSKPVTRWLLFLAKFLGGCTFILIGATYLIGGLWLILGIRFGTWEPKLLVSIPIYLFVFAIYYSVAALVGAIWRSAVVSIGLTMLFWIVCFLIGTSKIAFETAIWNKARIIRLLHADEVLLAVNETGIVHQWEATSRQWEEVFVSPDQQQSRGIMLLMPSVPREFRPIGPVYDPQDQRLISVQPTFPPTKLNLYVGERTSDWEAVSNLTAPTGTLALFREPQGTILLVSSMGLYRLRDDPLQPAAPLEIFGFALPWNPAAPFQNVSPDPPVLLTQPAAAAMHADSGALSLFTRGVVTLLEADEEGVFRQLRQLELDGDERQPAAIGYAGNTLVVGRDDGRIQVYDSTTLELQKEFRPSGGTQPRFITAASSGNLFALVYHDGQLWLYDSASRRLELAPVSGQGTISAAVFSGDNSLWVADRTVRVSRYRLPSMELAQRFSPRLDLLATAYRYGLVPLYTVFPKPGELDRTVQFLLSGRQTEGSSRGDLVTAQRTIDPWTPVWSSAAFMFVMLAIACIYVQRQDF